MTALSPLPDGTFRGYPIALLHKIQHLGPSLVDDQDLYAAAQAFTDSKTGGGHMGPALLAQDSSISVNPPQAPFLPAGIPRAMVDAKPHDADDESSPWDKFDLLELRDILQANNVEYPRTMTTGGAIKRLEAAGIAPPTD